LLVLVARYGVADCAPGERCRRNIGRHLNRGIDLLLRVLSRGEGPEAGRRAGLNLTPSRVANMGQRSIFRQSAGKRLSVKSNLTTTTIPGSFLTALRFVCLLLPLFVPPSIKYSALKGLRMPTSDDVPDAVAYHSAPLFASGRTGKTEIISPSAHATSPKVGPARCPIVIVPQLICILRTRGSPSSRPRTSYPITLA
jgi:hypothetical protein